MKLMWLLFAVVVLSALISTGSGAEFTDTFQHQTAITDNWQKFNGLNAFNYVTSGATYNEEVRVYRGNFAAGNRGVRMKYPAQSTYWSFFLHKARTGFNAGYITVNFWDSTNTSTVSFYVYGPFQSDNNWVTLNRHLEFQYESGSIYWRINGVDQGVGCACTFTPSYIGIGGYKGTAAYVEIYFDNVHNQEGIVGICDESNNIEHTITELTNYVVSNTWGINTVPTVDYDASQYDIEVKRATWAEIYKTTRLKDTSNSTVLPYGSFTYNWSDIFRTDHYGLYWFNLYKTLSGEPELIGQDFIYFKDVGEPSTINIEDTEYAIGETMNISYYIDSPDFGANQYKIQIFDATGQLKDTRVLVQQAATEQITSTIDWEEGMLYAVLVKDTKPAIEEDPPEDIIDLAYDFCTMSNVIYITGKVYGASNADMLVDGTLLDNVSLNWTQAGTIYNTTSDANGNYEFIDATTLLEVEWFQDVPITIHAEKTGYTHSDFDMTIIKAGRYTVNVYMMPSLDYDNTSISGVVADNIFHQSIPYAEVHIWNTTWSNATYTNAWGWYKYDNLTNGTYNMYAKKETYRDSSVVQVKAWNISLTLDSCDSLDYIETTLDECDATTGWTSDNTLTLNTTDYIEATGALQSVGTNTEDFNKTFSPAVDSNITSDGHLYFYSKIDNTTNISSVNLTVTLSSNATGATNTLVWEVNKTFFSSTWNLTMLAISAATETGTCDLSAIRFFKLESTKSTSVTTKIDFIAFIEYVSWDSNLNLSLDTSDKMEGGASIKAYGKAWVPNPYVWKGPGGGIPTAEYYIDRYWGAPGTGDSRFSTTNSLGRLQMWYKPGFTSNRNIILASGDTTNYLYWENVGSVGSWTLERLFFENAYENETMDLNAIKWFVITGNRSGIADVNEHIDNIRLVQAGETRQNFFLSQNYNLTVYAKDMDTRYTITSFTAILDSTTVAETTTAAIVFPNVTYGIYPLEVSANGYYTNKQYVFMGQDTTQTVYLTKIENVSGGGAGMYYPPHAVEFKLQTLWGEPVEGVNVSATALETSGSSWDWLWETMGMKENIAAEIQNGSMNGSTDTMGKISFMMIETVKYEITFTKASDDIDKSITVYPKDNHYLIIVGTKTFIRDSEWYENVNFTVTWSEKNNTHGYVNLSYNDVSNETLNLWLYINETDENKTVVWNQYYGSSCNQTDVQIVVNKTGGKAFYVGFIADHVTFGHSPLEWEQVLKFEWFLDIGVPHGMCLHLSIAFLVFFACFFGATTAELGAIFVSMFAWIFHFIGWLEVRDPITTVLVLSIITALSVLAYLAYRSRRVYHN